MPKLFMYDPNMSDIRAAITPTKLAVRFQSVSAERPNYLQVDSQNTSVLNLDADVVVSVGKKSTFRTNAMALGVANLDTGNAFENDTQYQVFLCDPDAGDNSLGSNEVIKIVPTTTTGLPTGYTANTCKVIGGFHYVDNAIASVWTVLTREGSGSTVTVLNEGSGVIEVDGTPKAVVNFATDTEFDGMLADAGLDVEQDGDPEQYDLTDIVNMNQVLRLASYMKHKPLIRLGVESPIILQEGDTATIPVFYWGDGVLTATSDDLNTTVTVSGRNLVINRLQGCNGEVTIAVNVSATQTYTADSAYFKVAIGHRYGFRINKNDSNPATRVGYLYDAVGLTPAHMDFNRGVFDYGSWKDKWFVRDNKPLMLRSNGTVDYYLDPDNYALKMDGSASDVSNTAYDGNAMAQFPLCWMKMWEDADYEYCIISDIQFDNDYHAYAHTRADGSIADYFYRSMFEGSGNATKIRSLSGQTVAQSLTAAQEIAGCQGNGGKWYTHTWSQHTLITALLVLMGRSTDVQSVYGNGNLRSAQNNSGLIKTGTLDNKGQFFGYNTNTQAVKVFHCENPWGNQWDRLAGLINNKGAIYVKMTAEDGGYRVTDVTGYTATGITAPAGSATYVSKVRCSEYGFIPVAVSGSATTYYCDEYWANNGQLDYLRVGGGANNATSTGGVFAFDLNPAPSHTYWSVGCGLSCEQPAAA